MTDLKFFADREDLAIESYRTALAALACKSKSIADVHVALGLLREGEGLAMKVLADRGIDLADLRRELTAAL